MTPQDKPRKRLVWNLQAMMAKKGFRGTLDLQRELTAIGYSISSTQLARRIGKPPERPALDFLEALISVLDCDVSDLLITEKVEPHPRAAGTTGASSGSKRPLPF